jgi:cyclophilin family peptidyl-prolyl cis-trans isomerase
MDTASRSRTVCGMLRHLLPAVLLSVSLAACATATPSEPATPNPTVAQTTQTTQPAAQRETGFGTTACAPAEAPGEPVRSFPDSFANCLEADRTYVAVLGTNHGVLEIVLDADAAPVAVNNFVNLARSRYFDSTSCHRDIPGFVVQCGDPTGTGSGGPGYTFADELPAPGAYQVGSIAMANAGPDTNGSQFFIITGNAGAALPPNYTLFAAVTNGLDDVVVALDALGNPDPASNGVPPLDAIVLESVTIVER